MKILFIKGATMKAPDNMVTPYPDFWDLIDGDERTFKGVQTLYHALADPKSKVTEVNITSRNTLSLSVCCEEKWAYFSLEVMPEGEDRKYLKHIISFTKRRNKMMGRVLSGIWTKPLVEEEKLLKVANG